MVRHLLATTALVAGLTAAAWGEDASQQPGSNATVPPAAAPEEQPQGGTTAAQPAPEDQPQGGAMDTSPQPTEPSDTSAVGRATPGDAVIATQPETHLRAEELIGMTVVSADGK
ncbi:MAG: hypothetical protein IRY94_09070, partial [Rhodospirillaceae bacterium]|nr:hypothetical protein [Rhodospirillaceae bacterium]